MEAKWKRKDGRRISVRMSGRTIRNDSSSTSNYEVIVEDISDKRALEQQLLQAQKMEAVGRLAGGVAHDFNNALGVITGYSELLQLSLSPEDPRHKQAAEIGKAGMRAASLTRQLLAFSRKQVTQPVVLDLNSVVTDIDKMLRRLIGEDIDLAIVRDSKLNNVRVDRGHMEQVLMNLAVNARDAMPQGGKLLIETKNTKLDDSYLSLHPFAKPGKYVAISVSDTGCGMDKEVQSHIFEPFFTTKEVGKGTGLGLSMVYGIVKQSEGHISVYSEPGKGTTFRIYLPTVEAKSASPATVEPRPVLHGSETVLLVEDEVALRELARGFLQSHGYTVLEAGDGSAAIQLINQHEGTVHLLLTDLIMPGMSGRELAETLTSSRPTLKVIYMSGYTHDLITQHGVLDNSTELVEKPFSVESLLAKVRTVLDGTVASSRYCLNPVQPVMDFLKHPRS